MPTRQRASGYVANDTVLVSDGYMSLAKAEKVLGATLQDWGLDAVRDDDLDPILDKIAHALIQGTSSERRYSQVSFVHNGIECNLEHLCSNARMHDNTENPVRVWARSLMNAELAVRIYNMLKNTENADLRKLVSFSYDVSNEMAHVSFDFADALAHAKDFPLSQLERSVIRINTLNKVRASRSTHVDLSNGSSNGGAVQDGVANASKIVNTIQEPRQTSRIDFARVR